MLVRLYVQSEVQMICIWSSLCHCHPIFSFIIKIQNASAFLVPAYAGCPVKEVNKCVVVVVYLITCKLPTVSISLWHHKPKQSETSLRSVSAWMPHVYRAACSIPLNTYRALRSVWGFVHVVDWNMWAANTSQQSLPSRWLLPCSRHCVVLLGGRASMLQA